MLSENEWQSRQTNVHSIITTLFPPTAAYIKYIDRKLIEKGVWEFVNCFHSSREVKKNTVDIKKTEYNFSYPDRVLFSFF